MSWIIEFRKKLEDIGLEGFNKYYGLYRGFIEDRDDPLNHGRVLLKVPSVWGVKSYEYWAWPRGMFAGSDIGFYAIPEKGDMVWVSFENGNPKYPVWEYGHWNNNSKVPGSATSPSVKVFQVKNGLRFVFDEAKNTIQFYHSNGRIVEINSDGISLGKEGKSEYHALLGETTEEVIEQLRGIVSSITNAINTYSSAQGTAVASSGILAPLAPAYAQLTIEMSSALTEINLLENKVKTIKSEIITLQK